MNRWLTFLGFVDGATLDAPAEEEPSLTRSVSIYKRIAGVILIVIGYLLSPLCWWNDIVFNLPLALAFGYVTSRFYPDAFVPLTVVGYWLSNVVGFIMMQQGAVAALKTNAEAPNPRKAFINGMLTV
jgi:hypothetical protein